MTLPESMLPEPELRPALADVQAVYSRAALPDPYPLYERARSHGQVVPVPEWNAVAIFGHEEASQVLRSPAALSGQQIGQAVEVGQVSEAMQLLAPMMLFHNGPSHARLRGLVSAAFTPRVVAEQEELVRGLVREMLRAEEGRPFDLVDKLAVPLPVAVITGMLGLSKDDEQQFRAWTQSVAELLGGIDQSPELMARIEGDAREMRAYFRDLAGDLRAHPQPGLLSALAAAEDEEGRLSSAELLANAVLLLAAGHETTSNLIGRGVLALQEQPGAWAELAALPDIGNTLADELLRFTSPVQLTGRALGAPLEIGGQMYPAGTHTMLLLAAANRDERTFTDANRLNLTRANAGRHLAFASGPHYCLGASLARLETRVVFGELARYPKLRVLEQTPQYRPNIVLRGLSKLMVEL
ncbi:cytochrome P450 [Deinococcus rubellus]|uniref:Cytochrome P450 n=1 Tax=Deinococcus rubellus TaxID=1889240 RepID=A0ABY5YGS1_9DEIO|nr:cytochrome P450 [Deinococcus rubellus]UWX64015.1 cytochrome P450 [Deinococcus rubellus]